MTSPNGRATSLIEASRTAMTQMSQLLGSAAESVSRLARIEAGELRLHVEVVELERIPPSTRILASYEVAANEAGNVSSYRRVRRYSRAEAGEL